MSASQGLNMVMNIFCGVGVNAAMGIANQVNGAVYQFVSNFQTAFNPQIIKRYSSGERDAFIDLIFRASRFSYFMMFFLSLPVILNADFVLSIWLGEVPEYAADFTRWTLIFALVDALAGPLWMSVQATGKIRNYQLIAGGFIMMNLPCSILLLWLGFSPTWVLVAKVLINCLLTLWRIFYLRGKVGLPSWRFLREVVFRILCLSALSSSASVFVFRNLDSTNKWLRFSLSSGVAVLSVAIVVLTFGINKEERGVLTRILRSRLKI